MGEQIDSERIGTGTYLPDELIANHRQAEALRMDGDAERAILLREAGGATHGRVGLAVDVPALLHPRAADVLGAVHDRAGACGKRTPFDVKRLSLIFVLSLSWQTIVFTKKPARNGAFPPPYRSGRRSSSCCR